MRPGFKHNPSALPPSFRKANCGKSFSRWSAEGPIGNKTAAASPSGPAAFFLSGEGDVPTPLRLRPPTATKSRSPPASGRGSDLFPPYRLREGLGVGFTSIYHERLGGGPLRCGLPSGRGPRGPERGPPGWARGPRGPSFPSPRRLSRATSRGPSGDASM